MFENALVPQNFAINMLWLNPTLNPEQRLLFREDGIRNYGDLLKAALNWCKTVPNAAVTIWYDSKVTTKAQVENTQKLISEQMNPDSDRLYLKDIQTLPIVVKNPDIFSYKMGLYFRCDLLKLILIHHSLTAEQCDYAVFSDIGIEPISEEQLFTEEYHYALKKHGVMIMNNENYFIEAINSKEVIKSLALIINANLQRCWQGIHTQDSTLRKYLLDNLFRSVYYDTTHTLHFFSFGFINGAIYTRESDNKSWIEYDPEIQGHLPLGNYYQEKGYHNFFKEIDSDMLDVCSGGCDLYLRSELPKNPAPYKNSYLYIKTGDTQTQELYYAKYVQGYCSYEEVDIVDFNVFEEKINAINNENEIKLSLSNQQFKEIVTSNGGYKGCHTIDSFLNIFYGNDLSYSRFDYRGPEIPYYRNKNLVPKMGPLRYETMELNEFNKNIITQRASRKSDRSQGNNHHDPVSEDLIATKRSLVLLPYTLELSYGYVKPVRVKPYSQLFSEKEQPAHVERGGPIYQTTWRQS